MRVEEIVRYLAETKLNRARPSGEEIVAACPFHKSGMEKHPSFSISLETGKWICFSCGEAGDIHKLTRMLGVPELADKIEHAPPKVRKLSDSSLPVGLLGVFHFLPKILLDFGFTKDTLREHDIGFDKRPEYQRYTFPVFSRDGKLRMISGRSIYDIEPKYLIYREKHLKGIYNAYGYNPVKKQWLWREDKLVKDDPIIITEGFKAAMWLAQIELNSCALMGTHLSSNQAKTIMEFDAPQVYIFLDNDKPGIKAVKGVHKRLTHFGITKVKIANYPPGHERSSPDDLSKEEVAYALIKADNYSQYMHKNRYVLNRH